MEIIMEREGQPSDTISEEPQNVVIKGLDNLGNTCYMNSSLQALYATNEFRDYLLSNECPPKPLHSSLTKLFKQMNLRDSNKSIEPKDFWKTFTEYKSQFEGRQQHDAQEFLRYIIDGIHEEVNKAKLRRNKRTKSGPQVVDSESKAWEQYIRYMEDSFLVFIFVGQLKTTIECTECNHKSDRWEQFWDISLPLPETEGEYDVVQCLKLFVADEVMDSDSMPDCSQCKQKRKSVKKSDIEKLPLVLIIHLKRFGNDGQKIHKEIKINEDLKIKDCDYALFAVISHKGFSCSGGHYISHTRHLDQWFLFDDEDVTEQPNMDFTQLTDAYILFYHRVGVTVQV